MTEIRYYTRLGNTEKLAKAIGEELDIQAKDIKNPVEEECDLLFLGGAMYFGDAHKQLKQFIDNLSKDKIKKIAIFSTSGGTTDPENKIKDILVEKGFNVCEETFSCPSQFFAKNKNRPNDEDLANIKEFAKRVSANI